MREGPGLEALSQVITEGGIKDLVCRFYGKIREDELLGPVFNQAIKEHEWPDHLETMCDFWSSVMLKSGRYGGNPLQKHLALPSFDATLFDRWLALFSETAREVFTHEAASPFEVASQNIARSFKYMLYGHP